MCPKCGQPRGGSGRLTQWIMVCSCTATAPEEQEHEPNIELCPDCGKRIEKSRPGSFTQWVFRRETCNCKSQSGSQPASGSTSGSVKSLRTASGATPEDSVPSFDEQESPEEQSRQKELYGDRIPIDRYRVLRQIGEGASGTVYLCRDRFLTKDVAIKCLNNVEPGALVSFQQEARANSKLNHPNIVKAIDFGVSESGAPYMVLEYFNGSSLEDFLKQSKKVDGPMAMEILRQICDALSYTHKQHVWHRDLKPSNVLVGGNDNYEVQVRLIDFGVAAVRQASLTITSQHNIAAADQHKTLAGTPAYMSPDQAMGKPYDARSEIYSVGCLAFEMLTGRPPFVASTALEMISMHSSMEPPLLRTATGSSSTADDPVLSTLEKTIDRCLAKNPDDRFQTIEELKQSLSSIEESEQLEPVHSVLKNDSLSVTKSNNQQSWLFIGLIVGLLAFTAFIVMKMLSTPDVEPTRAELFDDNSGEMNDFTLKAAGGNWYVYLEPNEERLLGKLRKNRHLIKYLWLNTPITDRLIHEVVSLDLKGLAFDGVHLKHEHLEKIVGMKDVRMFVLMSTPITDDDLKTITKMKSVNLLVLDSTEITNEGLKCLTEGLELTGFSVGDMKQIDDRAVDTILKLKHLRGLSISRSGISPAGIIRILKGSPAYNLNMAGIRLNSAVYKALRDSHIQKLGLMNSPIEQETLDTLATMKNLFGVDCRDCPSVTQAVVANINAKRRKNGLKDLTVLLGHDNTARDWDIMIDDRKLFPVKRGPNAGTAIDIYGKER